MKNGFSKHKTKKSIRKITSILIIAAMMLEQNIISAAETVSQDKIEQIAAQNGALTDTFSFPNQNAETLSEAMDNYNDVLTDILRDGSNYLSKINCWSGDSLHMAGVLEDGFCFGIATATVLAHNGYLTPDEFQPGTEFLRDIKLDQNVAYLLGRFSIAQSYTAMGNYLYANVQQKTDETRVKELLKKAEINNANGNYFLIGLQLSPPYAAAHAVTGLGIISGDWTFNDLHYDKCILVNDPNCKNEDGTTIPCSPQNCIYINSEMSTFYIPFYETSSENHGHITLIIDDPELLLYHAPLHPEDSPALFQEHDYVRFSSFSTLPKDVQVYRRDGTSYSLYDFDSEDDVFFLTGGTGKSRFAEGDAFIVSVESPKGCNLAAYADQYIARAELSRLKGEENAGTSDNIIELRRDLVRIENNSPAVRSCELRLMYNEVPYSEKMNDFYFSGRDLLQANSSIQLQPHSDGLEIVSNQNRIHGTVYLNAMSFYENIGNLSEIEEAIEENVQIASSKVFFKYNDNAQELEMYVDLDYDGTYETKIKKGDINGDGIAFAIEDAQFTLRHYVNTIIKRRAPEEAVNIKLADVDNDGILSVSDAQLMLQEYTKNLTISNSK
jgi:hypothetical protein